MQLVSFEQKYEEEERGKGEKLGEKGKKDRY